MYCILNYKVMNTDSTDDNFLSKCLRIYMFNQYGKDATTALIINYN